MKIYLIRHGETEGNREHRYVGSTDEGLLSEAVQRLKAQRMPKVDAVYISPMKRCRMTAELLYPDSRLIALKELRECEFGEFEYRNYAELSGNPDYQRFIDTMGMSRFPGGEDRASFQKRCIAGFEHIMWENRRLDRDIAMVVHGGTIMAILDRYSAPHRDYYDWQTGNGSGFAGEVISPGQISEWKIINIRRLHLGTLNHEDLSDI